MWLVLEHVTILAANALHQRISFGVGDIVRCFVIMPYGGNDEQEKRHFLGVFQAIITPAALRAGYEPVRSDMDGSPGNITTDIIRDLADSEVVIADLTGGNANVLFELGIRHVFRKSGTVHLVDRTRPIPFDVGQYRAVKYSTDLAGIPTAIEEVEQAIRQRVHHRERSDNPVHDAIVGLPADLRKFGESGAVEEMAQVRSTLIAVEAERDALIRRLEELDPGTFELNSEIDVDKLLDGADEIMRSTGDYVLLLLKEKAEADGRDGFVSELRSVLKSPYLSANDFLEIGNMCQQLNLPDHRRAVFELAHQRYPAHESMLLSLIDAYDDSPAVALRERGRIMIEDYLKIERDEDGNIRLLETIRNPTALGNLFNLYFGANRPEWVLQVCDAELDRGYNDKTVLRNRARALADLGRHEEADAAYLSLFDQDDDDAVGRQWYSDHLAKTDRVEEAYVQSELGVLAEPEDPIGWTNLIIQIFNHGYVRSESGILRVKRSEATSAAMPLAMAALRMGNAATRNLVVNMLVRRGEVDFARQIAEGRFPDRAFDTGAYDYLREKIVELE